MPTGTRPPTATFRILRPDTLQVVGELRTPVRARWTRRFGAAGAMELFVHDRDPLLARILQPDAGVQVVRNGLVEETYWVHGWRIELGEGDESGLVWQVTASTVPLAVSLRVALPAPGTTTDASTSAGADAQTFTNQTPAQILRTLMNDNVVSPAEQARVVAGIALGNVLAPAKVAAPRGDNRPLAYDTIDEKDIRMAPLTRAVRFWRLLDEMVAVAQAGEVTFRFRPDTATGTRYFDVLLPADRRMRVDAQWPTVTFSLRRRMLRQFSYELNGYELLAAVYALGSGSGATRVMGVLKPTSAFRDMLAGRGAGDPHVVPADRRTWPRREEVVDVRTAGTSSAAKEQARDYLVLHQGPETLSFQPVADAPGATYLVDWDVGDLVTVDVAEIGLSGDTRVVEVTSEIADTGVVVTTISCGRIPRDLGSVLREVGRAARPAGVA